MTTNALSFVLRDVEKINPDEIRLMPIVDRTKAETKSFGEVLDQIGTSVSGDRKDYKPEVRTSEETSKVEYSEDNRAEQKIASKITEKVEQKETETVDEEAMVTAAAQFQQDVVNLLCTTLNITPEELENGMQELNMTIGDLLEPSNLAKLFVEFGDNVTVADILMSEDFQTIMKQVDEMGNVLAQELQLPEAESAEMLNRFATEQNKENAFEVQVTEPTEQTAVDVEVARAGKVVGNTETQPEQGIVQEEESMLQTTQSNPAETNSNTNPDAEENMMNMSKDETFEIPSDNPKEIVREDFSGHEMRQTTVTASPEGPVVQETVKVVDLQNLVSELTEYVRLTSGNDFSKIEMQLNPANLGKMIVEVSTTNGEITTKIITQTEAGKEAIEANMNQMRTNLEQQGVKVAAVEVTVESHAFEQNLQGEHSNEQDRLMKEQQDETRKHHMNLNLNEMTLDDLQGLMSEEEMLAVRMMRESGNKMDLTV